MDSYLDKVNKKRLEDNSKKLRDEELSTVKDGSDAVVHAIAQQGAKTRTTTQKVKVENDNLAQTKDVQEVVDSINRLNVTTFMASKDNWTQVVEDMATAAERIQSVIDGLETSGVKKIEKSFSDAVSSLRDVVTQIKKVKVESDDDAKDAIRELSAAVSGIEINPVINLPEQKVVVQEKELDLSPLTNLLSSIQKQLKDNKIEIPKNDFSAVETAVKSVKKSIDSLSFPVPNYILPFKDVNGKATQVQLDSGGNLPITANISGADGAIVDGADSNIKATVFDLTNSNPLSTQIVDTNGDAITSFGGGTQYTAGDVQATPVGTVAMGKISGNDQLWPFNLDGNKNIVIAAADPIPVSDNGGSLTIDGAVTANAGSDWDTSGLAKEAGGNLAAAATSLAVIDDWDDGFDRARVVGAAAHDAAPAGNPLMNGIEGRDTLGTVITATRVVRQSGNRYGHAYNTAIPPSHASSNGTPITATATSVISAPSSGNHLRVVRIHISNGGSTATWVSVRDGASGTQHYRSYLVQGATMSLNLNQSGPLDLTTATRLDVVLSAAGSVENEIDYLTVAD